MFDKGRVGYFEDVLMSRRFECLIVRTCADQSLGVSAVRMSWPSNVT